MGGRYGIGHGMLYICCYVASGYHSGKRNLYLVFSGYCFAWAAGGF